MQAEGFTEPDGLSDRALLRQYVERRSEAAFSRLVRRHLSLVYATCRREVGDPDTAEEVAQAVFLLLARKAPALRAEAGLAGWLFQTACFAAKNARRREARRQRREWKVAEIMGEEQAQAEDFWHQVEPHLNEALMSLGAADRECVLLRFFEGESLAEVGARLGLSENTARMRVARAVEKMRRHLGREGVTLAGVALAALLADRAAPAACQAAALKLVPMPGVLAPPPGPAGAHLYQFTQGVWKAMWIKTATTTTLIAAAFVGAVAVPLVVASEPRARPTGTLHPRSSDRVPVAAAKTAPVLVTPAPAVLFQKQSGPTQAMWQGVAHIKARTQVREATSGAAPEPISTLAVALGQAKPPEGGIALAVGAEKVGLLEGNAPTHNDASLEQVSFAYGRLLQRFGAVSAFAPPMMLVLNADPGQANIYADMPAADAFTLLTAGLTAGQLQALTSARGLGQDDLSNDYQRGLFLACIPNRTLKVRPRPTLEDTDAPPRTVRDISNELLQARMRLGQAAGLSVPDKNGIGAGVPKSATPGAPPVYDYVDRDAGKSEVDGVQVRAEVPNTPKSGQLDFKAAAFKAPVPLAGLKTVGDLIFRVGSVTRTEMYADKRYESRVVTVAGTPVSAPAGDLLRALALCLAGTYRRVGPAYVLTDDIMGLGTRQRILGEFQEDNAARRRGPLQKAEDDLEANRTLSGLTLNGFGDPLVATPEQMAKRDRNTLWAGAIMGVGLPLDQLTAPQQAAVRREADYIEREIQEHPERGVSEVDLNGKITLLAAPSVQLLVPGLNGTIDTDLGQHVALRFQNTSQYRAPRHTPASTQTALSTPATSGDLAALLKPISRRAVIAHPKTAAEVDALVARMKRLGLNQLWLDVFSGGVARIPNTPLSPADQPDLLAEALKAIKGTGISVFPTLDLLAWGKKAPETAADLTLLGQTSAQSEARRGEREALLAAAEDRDPPPPASAQITVSPFAPDVQRSLLALMRAIATRPGIGGLVWRETTPSGYDPRKNPSAGGEAQAALGYNEAARLVFLRREHTDPIDLDARGGGMAEQADTSLPGFEDSPTVTDLMGKWDEFRAEGDLAFLRALYAAARPAGGKTAAPLQILVRQRRDYGGTTWYGSWDSPKAPFPTRRNALDDYTGGDFPQDQDEAVQAKTQSQVALLRLPLTGALDTGNIASQCHGALEDLGRTRKWDGFVLELPLEAGGEASASSGWQLPAPVRFRRRTE